MQKKKLHLIVRKNTKIVTAIIFDLHVAYWASQHLYEEMELVEVVTKSVTKTIPTSVGNIVLNCYRKVGNGTYSYDYHLIIDKPDNIAEEEAYKLIV